MKQGHFNALLKSSPGKGFHSAAELKTNLSGYSQRRGEILLNQQQRVPDSERGSLKQPVTSLNSLPTPGQFTVTLLSARFLA